MQHLRGDFKCKDSVLAFIVCGGAEAERAIKGALVSALRPPIFLIFPPNKPNHSGIQWDSSTATSTKFFWKWVVWKRSLQVGLDRELNTTHCSFDPQIRNGQIVQTKLVFSSRTSS